MKPYILILGAKLPDRKEVQVFLDSIDDVPFWYACFARAIFLVSSLSAQDISQMIEEKFPAIRFLVTEIPENSQGMLPKQAWKLIEDPDNPRLAEQKN